MDPQEKLRRWLDGKLRERGCGAARQLAKALKVPPETVSRMRNLDGARETRRIEAHHIPIMARFLGEWPPDFQSADSIDVDKLTMVIECVERKFRSKISPHVKASCAATLYRFAASFDTEVGEVDARKGPEGCRGDPIPD